MRVSGAKGNMKNTPRPSRVVLPAGLENKTLTALHFCLSPSFLFFFAPRLRRSLTPPSHSAPISEASLIRIVDGAAHFVFVEGMGVTTLGG